MSDVCGDYRLSPVDATSLCDMDDLRPRGAAYGLTKVSSAYCLPLLAKRRHTCLLYFGAVMPYDAITSTSTPSPQCYHCVPKTLLPVVGQTFPDGISTRITLHPSLGARSFIVLDYYGIPDDMEGYRYLEVLTLSALWYEITKDTLYDEGYPYIAGMFDVSPHRVEHECNNAIRYGLQKSF